MLYGKEIAERNAEITYQPSPRFIEWDADTTLVTVPTLALRQAGWMCVKVPVHRISCKSYVDTQTGEIIKKRDMFKSRYPVPHNVSMKLIEQLCVINSLGKKARELCAFLLRMRNNRGSFVLPISDLVDSYINRSGKVARMSRARAQHYELIGQIAAKGVIANQQALGSLFQKLGQNTTQGVLEERSVWYAWPGIFSGKVGWSES